LNGIEYFELSGNCYFFHTFLRKKNPNFIVLKFGLLFVDFIYV
jgi:hypothetical protein